MASIDFESIRNLDHCWVCLENVSLHEHHIIPQCYGGTDGPTVTLCATCHNGVHNVSDGRIDDAPDYWSKTKQSEVRSSYLVDMIKKARIMASNSQNRRVIVTMELSAEYQNKLARIQSVFGGIGRERALKRLIDEADQRLTIR